MKICHLWGRYLPEKDINRPMQKFFIGVFCFALCFRPASAANQDRIGAHVYAGIGDVAKLKEALRHKDTPDVRDINERTPLHDAAWGGELKSTEYLIEAGADVDAADRRGRTPLHLAAMRGQLQVVKALVEAGADVKKQTLINLETPVCYAAQYGFAEIVQYLLEEGGAVDAPEGWNSPLHRAARNGHVAVTDILIKAGADLNKPGDGGVTPLHAACRFRDEDNAAVVKLLLRNGADPTIESDSGRTAKDAVVYRKSKSCLQVINQYDDSENAFGAVLLDDLEQLHKLLRNDSDIIHTTISTDEIPLWLYTAQIGSVEAMSMLVEFGFQVDERLSDERWGDRNTALHAAARRGHIPMMKYLLEQGADVNAKLQPRGVTPIRRAMDWAGADCVIFLLQQGAELPEIKSELMRAMRVGISRKMTEETLLYLLIAEEIEISEHELGNIVGLAAARGYKDTIRWFLTKGISLDVRDYAGNTPLHLAAFNDQPNTVTFLLDAGADINARNSGTGYTALHAAARNGDWESLRILLQASASIDVENDEGETPFDLAWQMGHFECVRMLLDVSGPRNKDAQGAAPQ